MTLAPVAERIEVELSLPVFNGLGLPRLGFVIIADLFELVALQIAFILIEFLSIQKQ